MHRYLSFQAILPFRAVLNAYILEAAKPCHTGLPQGQLLNKFCHHFFSLSFGLIDVYNWVFIKPNLSTPALTPENAVLWVIFLGVVCCLAASLALLIPVEGEWHFLRLTVAIESVLK